MKINNNDLKNHHYTLTMNNYSNKNVEINKMKTLLSKYKSSSNYTHIAMGTLKGAYTLNRRGIENLFDLTENKEGNEGMAEMPQNSSMLRMDFDYTIPGTENKHLYDIDNFYNDIIPQFQNYLKEHIVDFKPKFSDCCILTKDPYIKDDKIKHGIHLVFPNVFISKQNFKEFELHFEFMKEEGYDNQMSSKPWLLYGQSKGIGKGTYKATTVFTHDGMVIKANDYFSDYKIYDEKEKIIKFEKSIEHYYHRIFSINLYGRDLEREFFPNLCPILTINKVKKKWENCNDDILEYQQEIRDTVDNYINDNLNNCYEIMDWENEFLKLKRTETFTCPTTGDRDHDNLDAYVTVNKEGKIFLGCYCNEGKPKYIGNYKNVEEEVYSCPDTSKLDLDCDEATEIYRRRDKKSKKNYDGKTYGYIVNKDYKFAEWICDNNVHPHAKIFCKILGREFIEEKWDQMKIDDLLITTGYIEKSDERWVLPDILNNKDEKCILIKAGLGKGKTTASIDHINTSDYDSIIVLSPRRTFAKSVANRLNAETKKEFFIYSDLKGKDYIIKQPFVVIQVESLNRLSLGNGKILVLCDEIESVLSQMTVSKTHKDKHIQNLDMLETLFKRADKIIGLDAFMSNRTLNTLKYMNIPYNYYNYTLPLERRACIRIDKLKKWIDKLLIDLGLGKKIFLFSSSNKKLVQDIIPVIKSLFPDKKILEYHSKFTSIDLTTINDNWKDADIIVCTSTITVGCNFDLPNIFDKCYIYANASSKNLVRDIFQASYRVRHFTDNELVYCIDKRHYGVNHTTDKRVIESDLKNKKDYIVDQYETYHKMKFDQTTPKWIINLCLTNIFEQNMSEMLLEPLFKRYLTECSYEHEELLYDEACLLQEQDVLSIDINFNDEFEYNDIKDLTYPDANVLKKKKIESVLSKEEEIQLEKYYFQHALVNMDIWDSKVEHNLWDIYKSYGKNKFRNMSFEKGLLAGTVRINDIISPGYPELSSSLVLKLEMIDQIRNKIGLKHSQDFVEVSKETIADSVQWFDENRKKIHNIFQIRDGKKEEFNSRSVTDLINKVFSQWGYSKIKLGKERKKINGKMVNIAPYSIINENYDKDTREFTDVYKYIKPKKVKQTEIKVEVHQGYNPLIKND